MIFQSPNNLWSLLILTLLHASFLFAQVPGTLNYASISLSTQQAFMGFPFQPSNRQGVVGIFSMRNSQWVLTALVQAPDGAANEQFGASVSQNDFFGIIGAPMAKAASVSDAGAAYIVARVGTRWVFRKKLSANDAVRMDGFGFTVHMAPSIAVVSAPWKDFANSKMVGAVYVYLRATNWGLYQKIVPVTRIAYGFFGYSMAVTEPFLLVGSIGFSTVNARYRGCIYVYNAALAQPNVQKVIVAPGNRPFEFFGTSVSLHAQYLLVGAPSRLASTNAAPGSALIYDLTRNRGRLVAELSAPRSSAVRAFAHRVAISSNWVAVSAMEATTTTTSLVVAAYLFTKVGQTWLFTNRISSFSPIFGDDRPIMALSSSHLFVSGLGFYLRPNLITPDQLFFALDGIGVESSSPTQSRTQTRTSSTSQSSSASLSMSTSGIQKSPSKVSSSQTILTKTENISPSFTPLESVSESESESGSLDTEQHSDESPSESESTASISTERETEARESTFNYQDMRREVFRNLGRRRLLQQPISSNLAEIQHSQRQQPLVDDGAFSVLKIASILSIPLVIIFMYQRYEVFMKQRRVLLHVDI